MPGGRPFQYRLSDSGAAARPAPRYPSRLNVIRSVRFTPRLPCRRTRASPVFVCPCPAPRIASSVCQPARRVGERVERRVGRGYGSTRLGRFRVSGMDVLITVGRRPCSAAPAIGDSVEEVGNSIGTACRHRYQEHEERLGVLGLRLPQNVGEEPDGEYARWHEGGGP